MQCDELLDLIHVALALLLLSLQQVEKALRELHERTQIHGRTLQELSNYLQSLDVLLARMAVIRDDKNMA